ncbi:multidrug efflux SMR transporter [Vibrio tritonius]|uniref:DMT family transporter n=1 Tax=Vibrio tritonius TaxID=1435069 RepID=UPI00315D59E7
MSWWYLLLAGLTEIGWPIGLKFAQSESTKWMGILMAIAFMVISGSLLFLAQRTIPMGTAYAVWTGIGAVGTFLVGVLCYGDPSSMFRYIGVMFIIAGVAVLKLAH